MKIGFVVNQVETEQPTYTTTRLAMAAVNRGHESWLIGTGDLALSLGTFPNFDARHEVACAAVHAACRAAYTLCGTFTGSVDGARAAPAVQREKSTFFIPR